MAGGRPSKLTPEVQQKICDAIRGGNYREVAAKAAGVGDRTMREWMARGEDEADGVYAAFRAAVVEAEQAAELTAVELVMRAAAKDPNHAKWWLERKFPERWGRKDRYELTGRAGGPVAVADVTEHDLLAKIARLAAANDDGADGAGGAGEDGAGGAGADRREADAGGAGGAVPGGLQLGPGGAA